MKVTNEKKIDWLLRNKQEKTLIIFLKKGFFKSFSGQNKVNGSI